MRIRRAVSLLLAFAVLGSACSGSSEPEASTTTGSRPTSSATTSTSVPGTSSGLEASLRAAGFDIVTDPASAPASGLALWSYQVDNMVREVDTQSGYLGAQLDELVGPIEGLPFSYLLAGWISATPTDAADAAREVMGSQPWQEAPSLVYPTAVLALFAADAVGASVGPDPQALPPEVAQGRLAQAGICSSLAGWVNGVLDFLFDALKVRTDDDGFLGWLGGVWNAAVDLARVVIGGLIEVLTAPIVAIITDALVVVGTLSMIASLLKPWSLEVTASSSTTPFAVGGESAISEEFVARVDTGIDFEWPAAVQDCASVAGLTLPDPSSATGSSVEWTTAGFPGLGSSNGSDAVIDDDNTAVLRWTTGREASDRGNVRTGTVSATATVTSQQIEALEAMLETLISGQLPQAPFGDIVAQLFSSLTAPIFEALADLVRVGGSAVVTVVYHDPEEEPATTAATTVGSALDPCVIGTWVTGEWSMPGPLGNSGPGGQNAVLRIDSDGTAHWDFDDMEPIVIVDEQIDVTTELSTQGSTTGTVSAMAGVWTATADTDRLEGRMKDNILGTIEVAGGPGLYVGILDGTYTCSTANLVITSIDPVENTPVPVLLNRT